MMRTMCVRYYADGAPADASMCSPRTRDAFVPRFPHLWDVLAEQADGAIDAACQSVDNGIIMLEHA